MKEVKPDVWLTPVLQELGLPKQEDDDEVTSGLGCRLRGKAKQSGTLGILTNVSRWRVACACTDTGSPPYNPV